MIGPKFVDVGPADSVWVADFDLRRVSVFDRDGGIGRSFQFSDLDLRAFVLDAGKKVMAGGVIATPEKFGQPLHEYSVDGRRIRSFGGRNETISDQAYLTHTRNIALDRNGGFWSARVNEYEIEHYDSEGTLISRHRRVVDWFSAWDAVAASTTNTPRPAVARIRTDSLGRLWVFIRIPSRPPTASGNAPNGERALNLAQYNRAFDTLIEVLDPRSLTVIARRTLNGPMYCSAAKRGVCARIVEQPDGSESLAVIRLSLIE
jgi:hypothetical protein